MAWPWVALGWVGLVPWLAALDRAASARAALGAGLLMAVVFTLAVFGWFASAIQTYTGAPWAVGVLVLALVAPVVQAQFLAFALARHVVRRRGTGAVHAALAGALVYAGADWASPKLFGDTLGHGLYGSLWMRQAADLGGAHGLTVVLVVANECVLAALRAYRAGAPRRQTLAPVACVAVLVLALLGYGAVRCRTLAARAGSAAPVTAGLVQADLSHYDRLAADVGTFEAVRRILDLHTALSTQLLERSRLDLLVWPETVYPTTFGAPKSPEGAAFDREIAGFVARAGIPLVFGAYDVEDGAEFNAAFFLEPPTAGRLVFDTYRKATLFPLTERVPAVLEWEPVRARFPWLGTWKAGPGAAVVDVTLADGRTVRIAPLICYDVLAPAIALDAARAGAELIVTLSNDSWFAAGLGPRLHLVGAAFRSIETRRPQVRATNTGISAVIDAAGTLLGTAGVHEQATLVGALVPDGRARTLMVAWGDWLGPVALAGGLALVVGALFARRAPGPGSSAPMREAAAQPRAAASSG
jgi:apolipoprotein N-acyltransferase